MVNEGAQSFPGDGLDLGAEVLDGVQVGQINASLVWELGFRAEFLNVHPEKAHFHAFDLLEQQHHLHNSIRKTNNVILV